MLQRGQMIPNKEGGLSQHGRSRLDQGGNEDQDHKDCNGARPEHCRANPRIGGNPVRQGQRGDALKSKYAESIFKSFFMYKKFSLIQTKLLIHR